LLLDKVQLKAVTSSNGNIAIGYGAGRSITTSGYNTILGYQAGTVNNTDRNTFLGCETGYANTTGHYDVFIGHRQGIVIPPPIIRLLSGIVLYTPKPEMLQTMI